MTRTDLGLTLTIRHQVPIVTIGFRDLSLKNLFRFRSRDWSSQSNQQIAVIRTSSRPGWQSHALGRSVVVVRYFPPCIANHDWPNTFFSFDKMDSSPAAAATNPNTAAPPNVVA